MDVNAYARQLKQLLPRGALWKLELESTISKTLLAISEELARVDARAQTLVDEQDPRTALETLSDWERVLGLPDDCLEQIPSSTTERQLAVASKLAARGGQTAQFYIDLAATLGYTVTISVYSVCRSGSMRSGDRCYSTDWAYAWLVNVDGYSIDAPTIARSGLMHSGDRLQGFETPALECVIQRAAPAHTIVLFEYSI